jgi:hypothetical protein
MTRSRFALAGVALAAAAGLVLVPTAASSHTDNLFTWVTDEEEFAGFGTASKTDAALAALGENAGLELDQVTGAEVCDEVGYAVGPQFEGAPFVVTWNHDTGALLSDPVDLWHEEEDVDIALDIDTLTDCTLIGVVALDAGRVIGAIDPVTGEVTVIADVSEVEPAVNSIATSADGTTYIIASDYGADASVATLNVETGAYSAFVELEGLVTEYGGGPTFGADFDAAGVLYLIIGADAQERYRLTSFSAGADLTSALPVDIGLIEFPGDGAGPYWGVEPYPLTAEGHSAPAPAPAPQLAATGTELPVGIVLAASILLLAGGALVIGRRRTA